MKPGIFKQALQVSCVVFCGASFAFLSVGYLVGWQWIAPIKPIWFFTALFIFGTIISFLIYKYIDSSLAILSPKQKVTFVLGAILTGLLFGLFFPSNAPILQTEHTLRIIATGKKNPLALANQVQLDKIMGPVSIPASDLVRICEGNNNLGWVVDGDSLISIPKQPSKITCSFSSANNGLVLRFGTDEWSGIVQLRFDQQDAIQLDLFSQKPGIKDVVFTTNPNRRQLLFHLGFGFARGIWLGLLFLLVSVFWISRKTRSSQNGSYELHPIASKWSISLLIWSVSLGVGLIFLYGRYDWNADQFYSRIGFHASVYLFIIFTPILYYLIRAFTDHKWIAIILTGIWWVAATLPYSWLGLDRFFYSLKPFDFREVQSPSGPQWFPQAFKHLPAIPYEGEIFLTLTIIGFLVCFFLLKNHPHHKKITLLGLLVYFAILLQSWMHLSLRAPYSYGNHIQNPENPNWFISYMFPNQMGAVNADLPVFLSLDSLYKGWPYWSDMLFRRSFYFYLTSQFSAFINLYYIGLIFNILLWLAAVICAYLFTRKYWSERVALLTAGMIATGRLFIWFVASPYIYLAEYASIIILTYLFERFVVEGERNTGKVFLFSSVLGLFSLIYDLFPFYIFIVGFGLLSKVNWKTLTLILATSLLIYGGLITLYTYGLGMRISTENSFYIKIALNGLLELIRSGNPSQWYVMTRNYAGSLLLNFIQVFLILPFTLALLGLFYLRGRKQAAIVLLFLVPAILLKAVLLFGNSTIENIPRLYYIAYPGIYILASIFVDHIAQALSKRSFHWIAWALPLLMLFLVFLLNNIDVWGVAVF